MTSGWYEGRQLGRRQQQSASRESRRALASACEHAARRSAEALIALQKPEGYWCGELLADASLESDYVLVELWLHPPEGSEWRPPSWDRLIKARRTIAARQLADGGWNIYPGGPSDVNATVKAYTALKLLGLEAEDPLMRRASERVLALGGVQAANSYVKINLSLFGLFPRRYVPTLPPEMMLVPGGVLYEMSSWTRAIIVPLSIVQAKGGVRPVPAGFSVDELVLPGRGFRLPRKDKASVFFHRLDAAFKVWEGRGPRVVRDRAIREAEHWMMDRTRYSEGLGAIYPAMMYFIMALHALGYPEDHPDMIEARRHFDALLVETADRLYFQPCFSPVWDTAICAFALGETGNAPADRMTQAADWLIRREVRRRGDWSFKRPDLEPSGWAFEFANEHYPDIDDTAMVLLALQHATGSSVKAQQACERRALNWLVNMQSSDGGWAAFDVDNNWNVLNRVPFADHNAMLDPTCPDITGRVIDCLCRRGWTTNDEPVRRGLDYLLGTQEKNGSWFGRWGVDYLYGTFLAVRGLAASGAKDVQEAIKKAAHWVPTVQNADGGWGESCASYAQNHFVGASSTPSQTAWALLTLLGAHRTDTPAFQRGIQYLLDTQKQDGTWDEELATGTGFPNVFYLAYTLYRNYFPLLALTLGSRAIA